MYSVYKHTSPSGKVYIGVTSQIPEKRWQNGLGYRTQAKFYRAICKYGWESFTHEVLYRDLTYDEATLKEKELILTYRSTDNRYGYNVESGGNLRKEVSQETRHKLSVLYKQEKYHRMIAEINQKRWSDPLAHEKMRERFLGERNPMFGKKLSEEHKRRFLEAGRRAYRKPRYGEETSFYGKHHDDIAKRKISEANYGAKNGKARVVMCVDTGVVYGCIREAYRATGVRFDSISRCCRGLGETAGGFRWKYINEEV